MMDTIIWTIGWAVAVDVCDLLTVKKEVLQGKEPKGVSLDAKSAAGVVWIVGIVLTLIF